MLNLTEKALKTYEMAAMAQEKQARGDWGWGHDVMAHTAGCGVGTHAWGGAHVSFKPMKKTEM